MPKPALGRSRGISIEAARYMPGGVNSSMRAKDWPRVFSRAKGARIWDADGNEYVDYHNAFGPIILGHADERVHDAVDSPSRDLDIVGVGANELELELARTINRLVPSMEQVLFTNSGSEATFHAIRLARAATGRRLLLKFQGCYHGWHDAVSANVVSQPEHVGTIDPISAGVLPQALEWLAVLPFDDVDSLESFMGRHGEEVAAIIVEPIIHTIGCVVPSEAFLRSLRRSSLEHGSILIFDEVVTGFRHDLGGYQGLADIRPDLTTFAKSIANGYPIGAVGGRADLMQRFDTRPGGDVLFGGTFNGNPVSVAAALATLAALEADDRAIHARLFALGRRMHEGLAAIIDRIGITARVQSFGSVFVVYFTDREVRSFDDALTNDGKLYEAFHRGMIDRGFYMLPLNLKRNHLTAAHSAEDVDRTLEAAEDVLAGLATGGDRTLRRQRPAVAVA